MTVGELQKKLKPLANDLRIDVQHQDVGGHGDITYVVQEHYEGTAEIVLVLGTDHWRP
jgi:hypothetical protein